MTPHEPLLEILPGLPRLLRRDAWFRVVDAVADASADEIERFDRALRAWWGAERNAYPTWWCTTERVGEGPWTEGHDVFRGFVEPTERAFRLARQLVLEAPEGIDETTLSSLAGLPWLVGISALVLNAQRSPRLAAAIASFARDPRTAHVREYELELSGLELDRVLAVLDSLPLSLERLVVHGVRDPRFAAELASRLASRPSLVRLGLFGIPLGREGLAALATSGAFDRLDALSLYEVGLDDEAARAWSLRAPSSRLRVLELGERNEALGAPMHGPGLVALADAGWLDGLESLVLARHALVGDVFRHVLARADLARLDGLLLADLPFGEGDLERLRHAGERLPALACLRLVRTSLGEERERWLERLALPPRFRLLDP